MANLNDAMVILRDTVSDISTVFIGTFQECIDYCSIFNWKMYDQYEVEVDLEIVRSPKYARIQTGTAQERRFARSPIHKQDRYFPNRRMDAGRKPSN